MPLILQSLDFTQNFHHYYYVYYSLLADGMRIFHMEAAIASLQFWTEDLDSVTPGRATENMFTTHFSTHLQVRHYASSLMKDCLDVSP